MESNLDEIGFSNSRSLKLWDQAGKLIPCGTQTLSKGPTHFIRWVSPIFTDRGKGGYIWDVDGNRFLDYNMALGPILLGYSDDRVNVAIIEQLEKGIIFSQISPLEVKLADKLVQLLPFADKVRFAKNGGDVTTAAVRVARACTGKDHVLICGYHGWHDWYIGTTSMCKGVPEEVKKLSRTFEYNNTDSFLSGLDDNVACVIMEGIGIHDPEDGFLETIREETRKRGILLIFDEIINGFRLSHGGASEYFNIDVDLATFGKALGNGMPISFVAGKSEYMDGFNDIFFSTTSGGECLSLAAALKTLEIIESENVIPHIFEYGKILKNHTNRVAGSLSLPVKMSGLPHHLALEVEGDENTVLKSIILQELMRRKILSVGVFFPCAAHTKEDLRHTLNAMEESLCFLEKAISSGKPETFLLGEPIEPVFKRV